MKVVIANFGKPPIDKTMDYESYWASHSKPRREKRTSLFEYKVNWGFHMFAPGIYLMDLGIADEVEFWGYREERSIFYYEFGVLWVRFHNEDDVKAYVDKYGYPDLYINYGRNGIPIIQYMEGKCFRVHVPCSRIGPNRQDSPGADCYLVDTEEFLDPRSMLYVPVVNTRKFSPDNSTKIRDFIYLAADYAGKRHDIVINAVRGTGLTGHFHPVDDSRLDLTCTNITTTKLDETDVVQLLRTSRIAVYPGDNTFNPAAMWECVASGLPIVVNENIRGGKHLVVPDVTGEFASEDAFYDVMNYALEKRESYTPREYFMENWDTVTLLESYFSFFRRMGWRY